MSASLTPFKPERRAVTLMPKLATELPFFYLTKQADALRTNITFEDVDAAGRPVLWAVIPNRDEQIGAPGIEAHEVWVRLIKPAYDEARARAGGVLPNLIPLGSVRGCLRALGWAAGGFQERRLLKVIGQISYAACRADFWVPSGREGGTGEPRFTRVKSGFTRMSVYAIGDRHVAEDELKAGRLSFEFDPDDVIYVLLNPNEVLIQQNQPQRPIDNEYLFSVGPAARRWYELLAPAVYGVTSNRGPGYCDIRYSWYVRRHHTLKPHAERRRVVQQMTEVVRDHLASGYLTKVEYRRVVEGDGSADFIIRYYPGEAACESTRRIRARLGRGGREDGRAVAAAAPQTAAPPSVPARQGPGREAGSDHLVEQLRAIGVTEAKARDLALRHRAAAEAQLAAYPYREGPPKKNAAGWLIAAIEGDYALPVAYVEEQQKAEKARKGAAAREVVTRCGLCDSAGWRTVITVTYPRGAVKRCTHDPAVEGLYPDA